MSGRGGGSGPMLRGLRSRLRRVPWVRLCVALVAIDLMILARAIDDYREHEELYELTRAGTIEALTEAVRRHDAMRERLLTNLANVHLRRGLELRSVAEVRAAVAYYREALRLDPELVPAKHNLELAVRVLESAIPPREPREPLPPDMIKASEMPLKPNDI